VLPFKAVESGSFFVLPKRLGLLKRVVGTFQIRLVCLCVERCTSCRQRSLSTRGHLPSSWTWPPGRSVCAQRFRTLSRRDHVVSRHRHLERALQTRSFCYARTYQRCTQCRQLFAARAPDCEPYGWLCSCCYAAEVSERDARDSAVVTYPPVFGLCLGRNCLPRGTCDPTIESRIASGPATIATDGDAGRAV